MAEPGTVVDANSLVRSRKGGERAEAQRERILAAAEQCFIEQGFHAASMASICDTAGMSAGLVYRYFANKNAITLAIIERQLQRRRADLDAAEQAPDFITLLRNMLTRGCHRPERMSPVLFLEMVAHASRDEQIKQALDANDAAFAGVIRRWLVRLSAEAGVTLDEVQIRHYQFSLKCFIEGLAVRMAREQEVDLAAALASAELLFGHWLVPRSGPATTGGAPAEA